MTLLTATCGSLRLYGRACLRSAAGQRCSQQPRARCSGGRAAAVFARTHTQIRTQQHHGRTRTLVHGRMLSHAARWLAGRAAAQLDPLIAAAAHKPRARAHTHAPLRLQASSYAGSLRCVLAVEKERKKVRKETCDVRPWRGGVGASAVDCRAPGECIRTRSRCVRVCLPTGNAGRPYRLRFNQKLRCAGKGTRALACLFGCCAPNVKLAYS